MIFKIVIKNYQKDFELGQSYVIFQKSIKKNINIFHIITFVCIYIGAYKWSTRSSSDYWMQIVMCIIQEK